MTSFNVIVPDNKISEFKNFLESIGANYSNSEFELSEEMIEILDERLKLDETEFISMDESLKELKEKYGL
jgi:hypothetical protein